MRGGLSLPGHKEQSVKCALSNAPIPDQISIAISTESNGEVMVSSGDSVLMGQLLYRTLARRIHASVSGVVSSVERVSGKTIIIIDNDHLEAIHPSVVPVEDYGALKPEQLRERIELAGLLGLGGASFPTFIKLKVSAQAHAKLLIINGVECEPYITCDDALMRTEPRAIVAGTQAMLHACEASRAIVAIEADKPEAIEALASAIREAADTRIQLQVVATLYPAGGERQLIQTLTGREVPSGGVPQDIDVLCQNAGTAAAVAHLINSGLPLIERIVTVTGSGVQQPRNLRVRIGTRIRELIQYCGGYSQNPSRLIMGGSMMGVALDDDNVSVSAQTNCVVAGSIDELVLQRQEMPCIRCGNCSDVCPAHLLPQQLYRFAKLDDSVALDELGLVDCIECGCCDYVCPSQIPLTVTFSKKKTQMHPRAQKS